MRNSDLQRIYLSPPHPTGNETALVADAIGSGWIAPVGPHLEAFEAEFALAVGARHAVALSSGTAGLHLSLELLGVGPDDEVLVPSFTFVATANPVRYVRAEPVFIDSDEVSWNVDPVLLEEALRTRSAAGRRPAAVVAVHLYGQSADMDRILAACAEYDVPVIEDAAEALGSLYGERSVGVLGKVGVFSFNGNKIITTSGGGMLVTNDADIACEARKLATQARDPANYYQHSKVGYNYRLSNLLAAVGRAQLQALEDRVQARRRVYRQYRELLRDIPGISFQPETGWGRHTRWLTCLQIDRDAFGAGPEEIRSSLDSRNIEARYLWKPMHLQPVYRNCVMYGGEVAERIYDRGLCLPSGSNLSDSDLRRVVGAIVAVHEEAMTSRPVGTGRFKPGGLRSR